MSDAITGRMGASPFGKQPLFDTMRSRTKFAPMGIPQRSLRGVNAPPSTYKRLPTPKYAFDLIQALGSTIAALTVTR